MRLLLGMCLYKQGAVQPQGSFPAALATASNLTVLDVSSNMLRYARCTHPL